MMIILFIAVCLILLYITVRNSIDIISMSIATADIEDSLTAEVSLELVSSKTSNWDAQDFMDDLIGKWEEIKEDVQVLIDKTLNITNEIVNQHDHVYLVEEENRVLTEKMECLEHVMSQRFKGF